MAFCNGLVNEKIQGLDVLALNKKSSKALGKTDGSHFRVMV